MCGYLLQAGSVKFIVLDRWQHLLPFPQLLDQTRRNISICDESTILIPISI